MSVEAKVNPEELREQIRSKYAEVAVSPGDDFHFHTGRLLTKRLGYDQSVVAALPDQGPAFERLFGATRTAKKAAKRGVRTVKRAVFDSALPMW